MMQVKDLQNITLGALRMVGAQVVQSTIQSISDEPESGPRRAFSRPTFVCGAIMTKAQWFEFRALCNLRGVWVNRPTIWPWGNTSHLFEYSISTVEMNKPTGAAMVLLAFGPAAYLVYLAWFWRVILP